MGVEIVQGTFVLGVAIGTREVNSDGEIQLITSDNVVEKGVRHMNLEKYKTELQLKAILYTYTHSQYVSI